jgi:ABC-2 type transport system permease protein
MSHGRLMLQVARWEFTRYFKPKQQIIGAVLIIVGWLVAMALVRLAGGDDAVEVAVVGNDVLPVADRAPETLRFTTHAPAAADSLGAAVTAGDLDALLAIASMDRAELLTRSRGSWIDDVRSTLAAARQEEALRRAQVTPAQLADLLAEPELVVRTAAEAAGAAPRTGRVALIVTLSVMLLAVFTGMSYIFTSITGEKQLRVTEQVMAAIPAQTWIDGKILGLAAVSLGGVAVMFLAFGVSFVLLRLAGASFPLPPLEFGSTGAVLVIVAFGTLGLFFWFAFLAGIAALIDDPNTSARSSFLFLPIMATALGFIGLGDPDSGLVRTLALLPPTAPAAMPARMLMGSVGGAEIAISLALLAAGVFALRIAAGRVFRLAMLMYGKEPSWREVRRWALAK